jgi:flagellar hook-associated protein 1 FlgK
MANAENSGTATLTAQIINSDYKLDLGAGTVTRLSDNTVSAFAGFPQTIDGVTLSVSSGATGGTDVFIIKPGNAPGQRVFAQSDNSGTAVLDSTGSNLQGLPSVPSDYRLTVTSTGSLQLLRLNDSHTWSAADMAALQATLAQEPQGFVLDWAGGTPGAPGDTFLIQPTRNAAKSIGVSIADPLKVAAAAPFRTSTALTNKGTGKIDMGSVLALDPSGVPLPNDIVITFSAPNTLVLDDDVDGNGIGDGTAPVSVAFVPGQPNEIIFKGMRFSVSGVPANGDHFSLQRNLNGVSDNRNAIALGSLQMAAVMNNGSATYQSTYGQIVSFAGNKTREIEVTGLAQQTLVDQAESTRQQLSGVNLDEEAANLLKFQQAYQSSAKVMEIAGKLFDELLNLGR